MGGILGGSGDGGAAARAEKRAAEAEAERKQLEERNLAQQRNRGGKSKKSSFSLQGDNIFKKTLGG